MVGRNCSGAVADSAGVLKAEHSTALSQEQAALSWSGKEAVETMGRSTIRALVGNYEVGYLGLGLPPGPGPEVARKVDWEGAVAWRRIEAT